MNNRIFWISPPSQRMFPSFLVLDVLTARQLRWKGERVKMLNTGIYSRIVGTVFPAVQKNICSSVWTIAMNLLYLPKFQQFCIVMVELLSLQEKFWIIKLRIGLIWVKPKRKVNIFCKTENITRPSVLERSARWSLDMGDRDQRQGLKAIDPKNWWPITLLTDSRDASASKNLLPLPHSLTHSPNRFKRC